MEKKLIPVTIIGGYLGAGKTSLLNHILSQSNSADFAILVNDFGALNVDAALIELNGSQAYRLENGCICCNIGNSLISTLLAILRMHDKPKRILIESSGVADPGRIADIARISPSLNLDQIITLVDSGQIMRLLNDSLVGETVERQLFAAHTILMNKIDLVSTKELAKTKRFIKSRYCDTNVIKTQYAEAPPNILFSSQPVQQSINQTRKVAAPSEEPGFEGLRNLQPASAEDHDDLFWRWNFASDKPVVRKRLEKVLKELLPILERAKGFVRFTNAPEKLYLLQLTRAEYSFADISKDAKKKSVENILGCNMVMIGNKDKPDFADLKSKLTATLETVQSG